MLNMKITKKQLKQIIKEELARVLDETWDPKSASSRMDDYGPRYRATRGGVQKPGYSPPWSAKRFTADQVEHLKKLDNMIGDAVRSGNPIGAKNLHKQYNRDKLLARLKNTPGVKWLVRFPFLSQLVIGGGVLLAMSDAHAKEGMAGVSRVLNDPGNQKKMGEALVSLTGVGAMAMTYRDILNSSGLKLSKADAFGGAAPEHTQKPGEPGRNCWTNKPVPGFPHCDELKESRLTKLQLKQLIKEKLENALDEAAAGPDRHSEVKKMIFALEGPITDIYNYWLKDQLAQGVAGSQTEGGEVRMARQTRSQAEDSARQLTHSIVEGIMTVGVQGMMGAFGGNQQSDADLDRQNYERLASDLGAQDLPGAKPTSDHMFRVTQALRGK
jgi:hypothetical protein